MPTETKRLETLALLALLAQLALVFYFWEAVQKAHERTHNTLGQTGAHVATADLFLYTVFILIFYFGSRMWSALAPHVFELQPERAAVWRGRLLWVRLATTFLFLGLTLFTIFRT